MHVSEATLIGSTRWDAISCVPIHDSIPSHPISPDHHHHRNACSSKQFGRWRTCTRPSGQSTENPLAGWPARQAIFVSRALVLFHVTHAGVSPCSISVARLLVRLPEGRVGANHPTFVSVVSAQPATYS